MAAVRTAIKMNLYSTVAGLCTKVSSQKHVVRAIGYAAGILTPILLHSSDSLGAVHEKYNNSPPNYVTRDDDSQQTYFLMYK